MKIKGRNILIAIMIILLIAFLILTIMVSLSSCRKASIVKHNLAKQADYFNCERKITAYNARTDTIIFEAEGYFSISNNYDSELVITFQVGPSEFKQSYIYLNDYTLYVVEDITGTHTDQYHYKFYFNPKSAIPNIDLAD